MNLPNKLTLTRIILVPVFMIFVSLTSLDSIVDGNFNATFYLLAGIVFAAASFTDYLDGHLARKWHMVTDFGKFADPLADKLLVTACMMIFVGWGRMPSWVVFIVIAREFAISGLRMVAASNGTVIAAGWSGKIKTSCTMVGLIAMMVLPNLPTLDLVVNIVILVTTVYSGVEYFCKNWACLGLAKKA